MTPDSANHPQPTLAEPRPTQRTLHGVTLEDPYAWLRDDNWREAMRDPGKLAPEIRAYLEAENAYTEAATGQLQDLQKALVAEMRGRILEDDASVPVPDGDWAYYSRFREGGEHAVFCRRPRDADARSKDHRRLHRPARAHRSRPRHRASPRVDESRRIASRRVAS